MVSSQFDFSAGPSRGNLGLPASEVTTPTYSADASTTPVPETALEVEVPAAAAIPSIPQQPETDAVMKEPESEGAEDGDRVGEISSSAESAPFQPVACFNYQTMKHSEARRQERREAQVLRDRTLSLIHI